MFLLFVITGY